MDTIRLVLKFGKVLGISESDELRKLYFIGYESQHFFYEENIELDFIGYTIDILMSILLILLSVSSLCNTVCVQYTNPITMCLPTFS